ncbi:hypothetical protein MUCCIDRAFT_108606 [Mucor lusitanicus CBS 277.49]|uniref:Uncharacterized protein n=1 Tax=Mucor lusitanicus CBS 277.49 TaxID=747725 RepID=A0A168MDS6_MUCCL|nr:hypothetical protein MUCCIDRAFT_108606 [Mucor lusitanicus CBS 277.49]
MATATVAKASNTLAPLGDAKGIHLLFTLPPTAAKTKIAVDVAVTRVTTCECQICLFNDDFYRGKTQLFRLRRSPEQDKVKVVVCCAGSRYELTQTVYDESGTIQLEHYKSTKQLVFKTKYNRKKAFKYDKEANKLVEVVWITADITLKKWCPLTFNGTTMQDNGAPQGHPSATQ